MANKLFNSILDSIERVGNRLPHPATLFFLMAVIVAVISAIGAGLDLAAQHPATGETIEARSLLSPDGIRWIYTNMEHNFVKFPPLGLVLVIMIGIGVAEGSGLFTVLVKQLVLGAPKSLVTYAVIVAGIFSHLASEVGYVILIPLGAMIFHALGRHPMAGFAGLHQVVGHAVGGQVREGVALHGDVRGGEGIAVGDAAGAANQVEDVVGEVLEEQGDGRVIGQVHRAFVFDDGTKGEMTTQGQLCTGGHEGLCADAGGVTGQNQVTGLHAHGGQVQGAGEGAAAGTGLQNTTLARYLACLVFNVKLNRLALFISYIILCGETDFARVNLSRWAL